MAIDSKLPQKMLLKSLTCYQKWISPWFGVCCRFYPSCSNYAFDAISQYGAIKGSALTLKRLLKCHPYHAGGIDFVP
jgi:uncharacterized protein